MRPATSELSNAASLGSRAAPGRVLLVDDEVLLLRSLRRILEREGHRVIEAASAEAADAALADPDLDVALCDLRLGPSDGIEWLERAKRERPDLEVVVMTGHGTIASAVDAIRRGAFDYLEKPFDDVHRVHNTVERALERRRLVRQNRALRVELQSREPGLIGNSAPMRRLARTLASLRHSESQVLIHGESGTGKELVARAIHAASPRALGAFVPVDCGSLPETIIESELFGHEKGAFTGALGARGLFRMAEGGTLFLDEIGELPLQVQAVLLRALQEKEVRPVGASRSVAVDIRVISATHRDLAKMVEAGAFRRDLYYRLNVVRIDLPPLRERRDDIPLLVQHFVAKHAGARGARELDERALHFLCNAPWPGNVRELENAVESALALATGSVLRLEDFPQAATRAAPQPGAEIPLSLEAYERAALERALAEAKGDVRGAARLLGIGRSTFYRRLQKLRGDAPRATSP
jgi:DNA-binding NtrC family response regulator